MKIRKTDILIRINPWFNISPKEMPENSNTLMALEYKDYDDFVRKYGELYSGKPVANAVRLMGNWADGISMLLKRNLVDLDIVVDSYGGNCPIAYEKLKPMLEGYRKASKMPRAFDGFD